MHAQRPPVDREACRGQEGVALITTIMVLMLCSVLMVGFTAAIIGDQRASGLDRDQTQAYAVAHAGLEKLTADLSTLFTTDFSPTKPQIDALMVSKPSLPGFSYVAPGGGSGYVVGPVLGYSGVNPIGDPNGTIAAGPYQGFRGILTPYDITVTARSTGGAEVRMRRQLQTVAVPVFQFGFFSELDLAFHAGEDFLFGGRVHTNGNLYLASAGSAILTLGDRVTAVGEVVRTHLPNGLDGAASYAGTVKMIKAANTYRNLARDEGSVKTNIGSAINEPKWTNVSIGQYNSYIRNGRTGARKLDLPIVSDGNGDGAPDANPIELIRRPTIGVADPGLLGEERFFRKASLRILLSDTAAAVQNLPGVTVSAPVDLSVAGNGYAGALPPVDRAPLAASEGPAAGPGPVAAGGAGGIPAGVYKSDAGTPLINGFIKIERQNNAGAWTDVTQEILALGIAGRNLADNNQAYATRWNKIPDGAADTCGEPNPNAVIRLQRVRDIPKNLEPCGFTNLAGVITVSNSASDYWPNALYDPREGQMRDGMPAPAAASGLTNLSLNGIMHYVELDVNNLRRWFTGQIGLTGNQSRNVDNGYIVYFSDRRNNRNAAGNETGEYGFEDVINPPSMNSFPAGNGALDGGEDLNGNNAVDVYGATPVNIPACTAPAGCAAPFDANARPYTFLACKDDGAGGACASAPGTPAPQLVARANRPVLFRRALKLVNGGQNQLPAPGLTVASENPIYVQGNYNATASLVATEAHVAASVIADSVTLLSNAWNDIRSFQLNGSFQTDASNRVASTTAYRMGIITGKTLAFPKPTWAANSFGSDGGAHNFVRALENWSPAGIVQRYRGSFVSFYTSRQGNGSFKCCDWDAYQRGERSWTFDTDFLSPTLLPPGTPMFRDINTLTFRQLLRPTQ